MCQKPLRVINPHYKKIAKAQHFDLRVFSGEEDYFLRVPCGCCSDCLKKRRQEWFVRAYNIMKRRGFDITNTYFCTFTLKPEVYDEYCKEPYKAIRRFIDRLRKDKSLRYKDLVTKRYRYRKIRFPFLFVSEVADGKRAKKRGIPSSHRLHFHAIIFGCPLPWWTVRHHWLQYGLAWVDPIRSMAAVRYVMKYITKEDPVHFGSISEDLKKLHGRLYVSHGFGRLSDSELKELASYMMQNMRSWFSILINNHSYRIPRYYRTKCFNKVQIKCRNDSYIPLLLRDLVNKKFKNRTFRQKELIYQSLLWQ